MSSIRFGVWAAMALILVPLAGAQSYSVTDLGTLPGGTYSVPAAINDLGQVVGFSVVDNQNHAFLWTSAGGMQDLGTLSGDTASQAEGINNSGAVVGESSSNLTHPFIWTASGGMRRLEQLGTIGAAANAITDSGEIVGYYYPVDNTSYHAFLLTKTGDLQDLGTLGGCCSSAAAINRSGDVVGFSTMPGDQDTHGFLWTNAGGMEDLGVIGSGTYSFANAVSISGEVFGIANSSQNGTREAYFWTQGTGMESLGTGLGSAVYGVNASGQLVGICGGDRNLALLWTSAHHGQNLNNLIPPSSGWLLNAAYGINNSGQIVASGTINGQTHAALLTPTN
jgi:probable HAF family extracellular repeat protein